MEVCPLSRGAYAPPILPITGWLLLVPSSSVRNLIGSPCEPLSLLQEDYGFIMFCLRTMRRVRSCLFAGGCSSAMGGRGSLLSYPLASWLKPLSTFGLLVLTTFIDSSRLLTVPSRS